MFSAEFYASWKPVPGVYSPPALHPNIWFGDFILDGRALSRAGRLIGREGQNLKRVTHEAGAHYIFLRKDRGCIEVWGSYESIGRAFGLLQRLVDGLDTAGSTVPVNADQVYDPDPSPATRKTSRRKTPPTVGDFLDARAIARALRAPKKKTRPGTTVPPPEPESRWKRFLAKRKA
jgi:hypothetical protein